MVGNSGVVCYLDGNATPSNVQTFTQPYHLRNACSFILNIQTVFITRPVLLQPFTSRLASNTATWHPFTCFTRDYANMFPQHCSKVHDHRLYAGSTIGRHSQNSTEVPWRGEAAMAVELSPESGGLPLQPTGLAAHGHGSFLWDFT